jgi:hypothetical protein
MVDEMQGQEIQVGGEKISARDEYLKTVTNLFFKINCAADTKSINDLQWSLNFYTDMLISSILNADARDSLRVAKEDIYQAECLKIKIRKQGNNLTDAEDNQARLTSCTVIIGEIKNYMDRYYGFEQRLGVLI